MSERIGKKRTRSFRAADGYQENVRDQDRSSKATAIACRVRNHLESLLADEGVKAPRDQTRTIENPPVTDAERWQVLSAEVAEKITAMIVLAKCHEAKKGSNKKGQTNG